MPQTILHRILETKRKEVHALRDKHSLAEMKSLAEAGPMPRNFYRAVTKQPFRLVNLIAEIKKASPSAGVIREDFDPARLARQYAQAGADALSVLTDETYFQGKLEDLRQAREASGLPVLRKDFLIDPWQVYEARAAGADAILLIAAALPLGVLSDLMILATELRMTCLVEVHDAGELLGVRSMIGFPHAAYSLLGVNNRDLNTFVVDVATTVRLAELAEDLPLVSESGIKTRQDVERLRAAGVKAVLIGEAFMRAGDIPAKVAELLGPVRA